MSNLTGRIDLRLLQEDSASEMYNIFLKPFADVFQVGKLSAMGIANPLAGLLKSVITFSPKKLNNMYSNYEKKRDSISGEIQKSLAELDPGVDMRVAAFFAAPAAFIGYHGGKKLVGDSRDILLDATGIGPKISEFFGTKWSDWEKKILEKENKQKIKKRQAKDQGRLKRNALNKLWKVFYEVAEKNASILSEVEDIESKNNEINNVVKKLSAEFIAGDLEKKIQDKFDKFYESIELLINEYILTLNNTIKTLEVISTAEDLDQLIANMKEAGFDTAIIQEIKSDIEKNVKKLAQIEEYIKQVPEEIRNNEEKLKIFITKSEVIKNREMIKNGIKNSKNIEQIKELTKAINEELPSIEQLQIYMKLQPNENLRKLLILREKFDNFLLKLKSVI